MTRSRPIALLLMTSSLLLAAPVRAEEKLDPTVQRFRAAIGKADTDREALRKEVLAFWRSKVGTPAGVQAAAVLTELPSPLDQIDHRTIGELERFAWQPKELVAVLGEHRGRHGAAVSCLVYTRDGKRVISGGAQGFVRLFDSTTLKPQAKVGTGSATTCLAVSRDSKTLAAGNAGGGVYVWDISGQQPVQTGVFGIGTSAVYSVDISADGKLMAAGVYDGLVHTWDMDGSKPKVRTQLSGHKAAATAIAFAPDSRHLAAGAADGTIRFWSFQGERINELGSLAAHTGAISCMIYNPRGGNLMVGCNDGHIVRVNLTGKFTKGTVFKTPAAVTDIGYSPGVTLTSSHSDGIVRIWGGATFMKPSVTVEGHFGSVSSFAWSPDGRMIATGGADWTVRQWNMPLGAIKGAERLVLRGHWMGSNNNLFAPDGKHLATASSDRTARVWDLGRTTPIQAVQFPPTATLYKGDANALSSMAWTPDSKDLATGGTGVTVRLWDIVGRKQLRTYTAPSHVGSLLFTPDGQSLIGVSHQTVVSWATISTKELMRLTPAERYINGLAISHDGRYALAGTGYYVLNEKQQPVMKDGKYVYQDIDLKLFELRRGQRLKERKDLAAPVGPISYHPDGRSVIALWSCAAHLWETVPQELKEIRPLKGFTGLGHPSLFSPDGRRVLTGSTTFQLVDFETEKVLKSWTFDEVVYSFGFSPDGRYLAVSIVTGPVYILRLQEPPVQAGTK